MESNQNQSGCLDQLKGLIEARVPYIWVTTYEEKKFIEEFYVKVSESTKRDLYSWSAVKGFEHWTNKKESQTARKPSLSPDLLKNSENPLEALQRIENCTPSSDRNGVIFIMKDFHCFMNQSIPRYLRDMYDTVCRGQKTIVFLSPSIGHGPGGTKSGLEPTLDKQITVINYDLPNRLHIRKKVNDIIEYIIDSKEKVAKHPDATKKLGEIKSEYTKEEIENFISALQGLTDLEMDNAIYTSIKRLGKLEETYLLSEKKQVIKRSDILEYIEQHPDMDSIGGLDEAKRYVSLYRDQFTPEAQEFGVEPLRGIILTGIPGTGKSLLAKAIASEWSLPLLRLDVGKVMTGLVGGSEEKMRHVIAQVEAVAPCVLWIDEVEKSLSGTKSSNFSDGGTLSRVFGTLLTAMEERFEGVVTIATANDVSALPPELIRRFNELFFVDLPEPAERDEILRIHLNKRKRDADELGLDMEHIVNITHKYTGSELEKAVSEAIIRSFRDGRRPLTTADLVGAIEDTKPIASVMAQQVTALRTWAKERARYASSLAAAANAVGKQKVTTKSGKELRIEDALDGLCEPKSKDQRLDGVLEG